MSPFTILLFVILTLHSPVIFASDPDPIQDFCVVNGFQSCKNSSYVDVEDFVFSGIKFPGKYNEELGVSIQLITVNLFPGLNTLGMSFTRVDFKKGGINVPHYHPRATEIAIVLEGRIYTRFIDTENRIFAKVLEIGEVMVYPRGLLHFQMNVGDKPATLLGNFDSENPGVMKIPRAVFGSGIREELLEKAFGLDDEELAKLRNKLSIYLNN